MNNPNNDNIEIVEDSIDIDKPMMLNSFEKEFTKYQFDSICKVEKISNSLNDWHMFISKDAETEEIFKEYMYIKSVGQNEAIYRLIIDNYKYKLTKRIIKE